MDGTGHRKHENRVVGVDAVLLGEICWFLSPCYRCGVVGVPCTFAGPCVPSSVTHVTSFKSPGRVHCVTVRERERERRNGKRTRPSKE